MGIVLVVVSMLIWGSVGLFVRWADQPSAVIVFYRVLVAFLVIGLLQLARGEWKLVVREARGQWLWTVLGGVVLACNWIFFFQAVQLTTVANAVLFYYLAPVIVMLLSPLVLQERLQRSTVLAALVAFAGTAVMQPGSAIGSEDWLGILSALTAAFFYAMVTITGRKVTGLGASRLVLWQTGVATVVLLPYVLWQGASWPSASSFAAMATLGVVHTALALTLYFRGLQRVKVQHAGVLGYLDPVSAILFAYLFLGETLDIRTLIGGSMILISSTVIFRQKEASPLERGTETEDVRP